MFYNMVFGLYVSALLLTSFPVADCLHYYKTPALDNQFSNFEITTAIPSDGANGTGKVQDALNLNLEIASWPYARRYFTFNFKGRGDAQLWILNSDKTKQFKVEIGGGANHDQVYVIDNKNNCFSTRVNNITSEKEYRSFWIRGKWPKNILGVYYRVVVGFGSDSHKNKLLSTDDIDGSKMNMSIIRLSTSIDSLGEWQFASAGRTLGGCGDAIPCIDDDTQCCGVNLTCGKWNRIHTRMIGTCIPPSDFFPSLVFGDGKYPTACGIGEEVCGSEDDCSNNTCKAMNNTVKEVCASGEDCRDNICQATPATTTVKLSTKLMATTTPTSTLPTTTQPITAMLTQTTTRSTISIAIATIMQNPTFTPNTTLPNITLTLVVTTDRTSTRSLSYLYTNRWAILAGTASGLFVIGAATWILLSYAVQYKRDLLHRRRVSPARIQNPENDNGNNIISA